MWTLEEVRGLPKVLLHDHLDGGLRPATIVELAQEAGHVDLPTGDPAELASWMRRGADRKDLVLYLETFAHTVGVMQTSGALARVARECAEDLAADGVIYAEVRFAPELHVERGLALDEVLEAVQDGFRAGTADRPIDVRTIVTAMRDRDRSAEIAALAARWHDRGVVGFDLAGPEAGFPASHHQAAVDLARAGGLRVTIHAGEAFGLDSIRDAISCGAERLGHGVRIVDDIGRGTDGAVVLGPLASEVHDRGIALELCPTSNVHSGAAASIPEHPIGMLADLGFIVTVNTDNRLMSATTASRELAAVAAAFGWDRGRLARVAEDATRASFLSDDERARLLREVRAGFAEGG